MEVQPDFKELLELFNRHHVEFLLVGGYALAFHGVPRYTGDMDLFVRPSSQNAARIMAALSELGFGDVGLTSEDFQKENRVIQLGVPPVRLDLLTSLTGVSWAEAWPNRVHGQYGDAPVCYIARDQLVSNKRAMGRRKDLADLEALGED